MQAKKRRLDIPSGQAPIAPLNGKYLNRKVTLSLNSEKSHEPPENSLAGAAKGVRRLRDILDETRTTRESIAQRECILLLLLACVMIGFSFFELKGF